MEENFKVPSLDSRIKFVSRKPTDKSSNDSTEPPSNISESTADSNDKNPAPKPNNVPPKQNQLKCPYVEPKWSEKPEHVYSFEVLKGGTIAETFDDLQNQAYWLIGKLPDNHIAMAHPTVSRYHGKCGD